MGQIHFFNEGNSYRLRNKKRLDAWIRSEITRNCLDTGDIVYVICNDEFLHEMNKKYLKHDTYTDIITFNMSDDPGRVSGEIYISIDRVRDNAQKYGEGVTKELHRVMIHGILHLLGHNDQHPGEKEKMRKLEEEALKRLIISN